MIAQMIARPKESDILIERKKIRKITNEQVLRQIINRVVMENPLLIVEWRRSREGLGKIMGKVMFETQNRADASTVRRLLEERLVRH